MIIIKLNKRYVKIEDELIEISKGLCEWLIHNTKMKTVYELGE